MDGVSDDAWQSPVVLGGCYAFISIVTALLFSFLPVPSPWVEGVLGVAAGLLLGPVGIVATLLGELFRLAFDAAFTLARVATVLTVVVLTAVSVLVWPVADIGRQRPVTGRAVAGRCLAVAALTGSTAGWIGAVTTTRPFFPYGLRTAIAGGLAFLVAAALVFAVRRHSTLALPTRGPESPYRVRTAFVLVVGVLWLGAGTGLSILGQDLALVPTSSLALYVPSLVKSLLLLVRSHYLAVQMALGVGMLLVIGGGHRHLFSR